MPIDAVVADANVLLSAVVGKAALRVFTEYGVTVHATEFNASEVEEYLPRLASKYGLPEDLLYLEWRLLPVVLLGDGFDGVLPWCRIDNRPFLRCLHGLGLCLWRLGRHEEAAIVFEKMLWLNPTDNQGVRFLLPQVQEGRRWEDHREGG